MNADEELLCKSWNRDLRAAWAAGEITFGEAVFLARRVDFECAINWLPDVVVEIALGVYDAVFEP